MRRAQVAVSRGGLRWRAASPLVNLASSLALVILVGNSELAADEPAAAKAPPLAVAADPLVVETTTEAPTSDAKPAENPPANPAPAAPPTATTPASITAPPATTGPPTIGPSLTPTKPGTTTKSAEAAKPAEPPKPAAPPAGAVAVSTIDGERIVGPLGDIKEGQLTVQSQPPRTLALDAIERVEFGGAAAALKAEWLGQDQHDVVQVGGAAGGNGIVDMHLRLTGLPSDKKIAQLVVVCRYPGQVRVWRLDTTQSPHWKIAMERSGQASLADLYMEPTGIDAFGHEFAVTITYEGGSTDKTAVKAATHTSDQQKVGVAAVATTGAAAPAGPPAVTVQLDGSSSLGGKLLALEEESLTLATAWGKELKIPLVKVAAIAFAAGGAPAVTPTAAKPQNESDKKADKNSDTAASEDSVTMLGRDGKSVTIRGHVLGFSDGKLQVEYDGEKRSINQARLVSVTLSAHPQPRPSASPYQVVQLASGDRLLGQLVGATDKSLTVQTAWDAALEVPREAVSQIAFRNGKLVYLSDLEPVGVEETPYFGRRMPYHRDESLTGGPLKIKGTTYTKGLAVHARSVLQYALDGQYESFRALLGFDDEVGKQGAVACRVLGDDRELLKVVDLRATGEVVPIELSVAGVKQLTLEVDFGDLEDTGDRVIWAQPRIFRAGASEKPATSEKPAASEQSAK